MTTEEDQMTYTTHGLMTPLDLQDTHELHDQHIHPGCPGHSEGSPWATYCTAAMDCPGAAPGPDQEVKRMGTYERMSMYFAQSASGKLTARQRRRLVKKAAKDPEYEVLRGSYGMGYSPARQGQKEIAIFPVPVSGQPY